MISVSGKEFIKIGQRKFIENLSKKYNPENGQLEAWIASYTFITDLVRSNSKLKEAHFVFEYPILFTDERRPDILMFVRNVIYIIEFKNRGDYREQDIKQLTQYWEQISFFHAESSKYMLKPLLILNSEKCVARKVGEVHISSVSSFISGWKAYENGELGPDKSVENFLSGKYNATVGIADFAERYLNKNPLPGLNHPLLDQTKKAIEKVSEIIEEARQLKLHSLVLITGEAGSGKSAMALQIYSDHNGAFLTKNTKFLKLIGSRVDKQPYLFSTNSVVGEYFKKRSNLEPNVVLIDEAQRVWDNRRIYQYHHKSIDEHSILLSHIKKKEWSTTVAFIGVEQELASSETSYIDEWFEGIREHSTESRRRIYCSPLMEDDSGECKSIELFHLNCNLRSNIKDSISKVFFKVIEEPNDSVLRDEIIQIKRTGYKLLITRNLNEAVTYLQQNIAVADFPTGIIGTSEFDAEFKTFINYNKSKSVDIKSYIGLKNYDLNYLKEIALTQFDCLGFEFDIPILHWNVDYTYYHDNWNYEMIKKIEATGLYYIRNAYKVLLTRGRNGIILYFPQHWQFTNTYKYFKQLGFEIL